MSDRSLTIAEFCDKYSITQPTYFTWQKTGIGPEELRVGKIIRITPEAERAWLEARARDLGQRKIDEARKAKCRNAGEASQASKRRAAR